MNQREEWVANDMLTIKQQHRHYNQIENFSSSTELLQVSYYVSMQKWTQLDNAMQSYTCNIVKHWFMFFIQPR